jgi:hypothetical protein
MKKAYEKPALVKAGILSKATATIGNAHNFSLESN